MLRLLTIAKNTFTETLRQPIYAVIIIFSLILLTLAPGISAYTLDEDIKLLRELGLSTLFLAGLFISVFSAISAITEEIDSGTITTILSKPISRPVFVLGKYLGICAAITLAHILLTMAFMMANRHGVLENATDSIDWTVITAAGAVLLTTFFVTAFLNYVYDWNVPSTGVLLATVLGGFAMLFLFLVDRDWTFNPSNNQFEIFDLNASFLLLLALFVLAALAILFSTRFNEVVTLTLCVGIFLLGLISDWLFGRLADQHIWAHIGEIMTPNLQIYWVSDAIYETGIVPAQYLLLAGVYTVLYITGIIALAIALFQRRQVG